MPIIIAHLTGRLLGGDKVRKGAEDNWPILFKYCTQHNILLEINSRPNRCDIHSLLIRNAVEIGCQFIINTDNHHDVKLRKLLKYGIIEARKGGLNIDNILNTNFKKVNKWIKRK